MKQTKETVARSETPAEYHVNNDDAVISAALAILDARMKERPVFDSPASVKAYLRLQHAGSQHEYEVFGIMFLDAQHKMIEDRLMFRGTLTQTSVYPREVVKAALALNAAAVILHHNHPSGGVQPSQADESLTRTLKATLDVIDVRVLDHIVVGGASCFSFAESGML